MRNSRRRYYARHMKKKRSVLPVVLAAVVITIIALAYLYLPGVIESVKGKNKQNELQELYRGGIMDLIFPSASAEEAPVDVPRVHDDFAELYAVNPHVIGWLSAGERIDYPVVQYDNTFYLEHDFYGNYDNAGTLFINAANKIYPRDDMLLIHGHNMRVGTMFGDLDFFREYSYLKKYPIVTFRLTSDEEDVYYVPVAGFDASMNPEAEGYFDITRVRFDYDILPENEGDKPRSTAFEQYIAELRAASYWNSPVEADSTDDYIMLITCSYLHDDGRMLLICRQLREGETPESVSALFTGK